MARSTDEIYDLVVALDKKLDVHLAVHAEREKKGARRWQVWVAVISAGLAVPMAALAIWVSAVNG